MEELANEVTYPKFDFNPYACMSLKGLYWSQYSPRDELKVAALRECIYAFGQALSKAFCFYRLTRHDDRLREHYCYLLEGGAVAFVTANDYSLAWKILPQELFSVEDAVVIMRVAASRVQGAHKAYFFRVFRALQMLLLNVPDQAKVGFHSKDNRLNFSIAWPKNLEDRVVLAVTVHVLDGFDTRIDA